MLAGTEVVVGDAERQLSGVLKLLRRLRRASQEGDLAGLASRMTEAADAARAAAEPLRAAADAFAYDTAAAFADGSYLSELATAARQAELTLVQRDGRITAYPVILRLDARAQAVRIGKKLERRIRPAFLAAELKKLQSRPSRFNAGGFLDRMLKPYALLARAETPGWRPDRPGPGPVVSLSDLYDVLTLAPVAAADYPVEEFVCDLLRLDRVPEARAARGHRFEFAGSTGKKGAKRLTLFDEQGEQHDYFAIRFVLDS
ncbi:MAG: hypothetical protein KGL52_01660 [Rhodospirillales bacterium]|nr:hypothetical protein [Rhodospirillales bacterium]